MKRIIIVFTLVAVLIFGCKKIDYRELQDDENSPEIGISVNLKSAAVNDTLQVEQGVKVNFRGVSNGPNIITWQWTFDDGTIDYGQSVDHIFYGDYLSVVQIRLLAIDDNEITYQKFVQVVIMPSLDGLPAIKVISSTPLGGGLFRVVMAFNKAAMKTQGNFFYIGDVTTTDWVETLVPAADTNFLLVNNALVSPTNPNDIGKFIAVRMTLEAGNYQMGVGRINDGNQIWGTYWGEFVSVSNPTLAKFALDVNGVVTPNVDEVTVSLPGTSGDEGENAVIRIDQGEDTLTLYTNTGAAFAAPFVIVRDSVGIYSAPIAESSVAGFPNWGVVKLAYDDMPMDYLLEFKFGPEISTPAVFSTNQSQSGYWDAYSGTLKIGLAVTTN